jgi:MFS family permease
VILAGNTTVTYLGNYMTTYATETLHMPKALGFAATMVVGAGGVVGSLTGGALSDRLGRKRVMLPTWILLLFILVPMFRFVASARTGAALLGAAAVLSVANTLSNAAGLTAITEGLPRRIRGQALGLVYAVAISIFGGSTQFTVAWLTGVTHSALAPAWYATSAVAISLVAMLVLPETAPGRARG